MPVCAQNASALANMPRAMRYMSCVHIRPSSPESKAPTLPGSPLVSPRDGSCEIWREIICESWQMVSPRASRTCASSTSW